VTALSLIFNSHREGALVGPSLLSLEEARTVARAEDLDCEVIVILDNPDALTASIVEAWAERDGATCLKVSLGDPASARNAGVEAARGDHVAFLDGDDLWSFNWLVEAHRALTAAGRAAVVHPEFLITFGDENHLWMHADSRSRAFDISYLAIANYWDALAFGRRETFSRFPFKASDLKRGYGHEDWLWNMESLSAGVAHITAPETIHFKRRRGGSRMAECASADVVVAPNPLYGEIRRQMLGW